jgi:hypothetical protein
MGYSILFLYLICISIFIACYFYYGRIQNIIKIFSENEIDSSLNRGMKAEFSPAFGHGRFSEKKTDTVRSVEDNTQIQHKRRRKLKDLPCFIHRKYSFYLVIATILTELFLFISHAILILSFDFVQIWKVLTIGFLIMVGGIPIGNRGFKLYHITSKKVRKCGSICLTCF